MTLATFFKFKIHVPGVSIDLAAGSESQFDSTYSSDGSKPMGQYLTNIFEMQDYGGAWTHRERGQFGIHYVNVTSGALDQTWTTADYTAVESAMGTLWTALSEYISNEVRLVEHRWYPFGPGFVGTKSAPIPPSRVLTLGTPLVGSNVSSPVRQVGSTVTLRTTLRRHWGRFYLPIGSSVWTTHGQGSSAFVDVIANSARTAMTGPESSQGVSPVVYDRARQQAYGVIAIECDSVPDIQRRRRPRDPGYRKIITS